MDGNLQLLGNLWKGNEFSKNLTLSGGSKQVDKNASIAIPAGDCTGNGNQGPTDPPSNPDYPIEVPNGSYYTFAMESLAAVAVAEDRKKELKNLVKLLMYREM